MLKLYAWEKPFHEKVADIRREELTVMRKKNYLNAVSTFMWECAPEVVSIPLLFSVQFLTKTNIQIYKQA